MLKRRHPSHDVININDNNGTAPKRRPSNFYLSSTVASREGDEENIDPDQPPTSVVGRHSGVDKILKEQSGKQLSITDLPHPSRTYKKRVRGKSERPFRKKYSVVESYTQQLKRKQAEFHWLEDESLRLDESSRLDENSRLDTSCEFPSSFHSTSIEQCLDHVVPVDCSVESRVAPKHVLFERNQIVPPPIDDVDGNNGREVVSSEVVAPETRLVSKNLVCSQEVTRSRLGVDHKNRMDLNPTQSHPSTVKHTGYRFMTRLQQQHQQADISSEHNNHMSLLFEANRFINTGKVVRADIPTTTEYSPVHQNSQLLSSIDPNRCSVDVQTRTHSSCTYLGNVDSEENGDEVEFFNNQMSQKPRSHNKSSLLDPLHLPPDLERLDSIITWLNKEADGV